MRGKEVIWDIPEYAKVGPIGESLGLEWGGRWQNFPDYPHFQLPGYSWSALQKKYGTPEAFMKTWPKDVDEMSEYPKVSIEANGKKFAGLNINGTVYAPVRAVAEVLGLKVEWDGAKKVVKIL